MSNEIRSPEGVVQCMDAYTVAKLGNENVIVALPNMVKDSIKEHLKLVEQDSGSEEK